MTIGERIISGVLTRAGTFTVRDEETTGLVVTCSAEEIRAVKHLPMYEPVVVVTSAEFDHLRAQLNQVERRLSDAIVENVHLKEELGKRR